jgi:DNA-binding transcriptional LysR family regulator
MDKHTIDFIIDTSPIKTNNMDIVINKLTTSKYTFFAKKNVYKGIKSLKDLEDLPLILPVPGTNNREELEKVFIKNNISPTKIINIHTSEVILNAVNHDLGIGYLISDIVKKDKNYKYINIKEELPTTNIVFAYNKKFLTSAPIRFIEEYMNFEIK